MATSETLGHRGHTGNGDALCQGARKKLCIPPSLVLGNLEADSPGWLPIHLSIMVAILVAVHTFCNVRILITNSLLCLGEPQDLELSKCVNVGPFLASSDGNSGRFASIMFISSFLSFVQTSRTASYGPLKKKSRLYLT
jgi:hypothetical protein